MKYQQNILETIGNTPLVRINKITKDIPATILAKLETFNPGHSIKDRMAVKMVDDAEKNGLLRPGGTIIECTSGNTGMGLALAAVVRGYRCIFTTNDKQSKEKIDMLKAFGAEVIVCPTNVSADDPRSYYSIAEKLSREIPNSYWFNQYDNLSNTQGHYESTGPELWEQTEGKITHLVVGVGTGGTISGTGRYLKERNPAIQVLAIDTYGSALKKYHETGELDEKEIYSYITEGIGEDIIPKNVDFSVIDHFEKVTDKDGAVMARRLAREEGLLMGYSAGSAMAGLLQMKDRFKPGDVVVVIFHDHGSRYVGKVYNDEWMRERGFLDSEWKVQDLLAYKKGQQLMTLQYGDTIRTALDRMKEHEISQMPVLNGDEIVGAITETLLVEHLLGHGPSRLEDPVSSIMGQPFPVVDIALPCRTLNKYISRQVPAVLTRDTTGAHHIITQYDLIRYML